MKRLFALIFLVLFAVNAEAATQLKKTVKPSGGDYTSLEACMNANEQDLTAADKYFDVEIDGTWSSADTTAVTVHNYTTDATRYINIYTTSTARHTGKATGNRYRINTFNANSVAILSSYVRFYGIEVRDTGAYGKSCIKIATGGNCRVAYCLVHDSAAESGYPGAIAIWYGTGNNFIYNNIVYKIAKASGANGIGISAALDSPLYSYIYSNTVVDCEGVGIVATTANRIEAKNNVSSSNTGGDYSGTWSASATNLSSDTSSPNTELRSKTVTFVSETVGSEDYHLSASDTSGAINGGTDLSATFTDDIDGQTRSGTWDIGADEYVSAGGGTPMERVHRSTGLGIMTGVMRGAGQ